MNWDAVLSKISSDGHIPVGVLIFLIGSGIHWFHGLDAAFVSFTTTVLAFLGGHAWVQKGKSDDTPSNTPSDPGK